VTTAGVSFVEAKPGSLVKSPRQHPE
jgi:hypothetical protein